MRSALTWFFHGALLALAGLHTLAAQSADTELLLELQITKPRAYLHEPITATVTLLAGATQVRDIQFPKLESAVFRVGQFSPPRQSDVSRDGHEYRAYEFTTTLEPRKPGRLELGPAEVRCNQLAPAKGAAAFFGGNEPRAVTLRSGSVELDILALPRKGRPADFSGAVGSFKVARTATPTEVRLGDPVTVTTRISGQGEFDHLSCPEIALPGARTYPVRSRRAGNRLDCEQVLIPEAATDTFVPAARVSYFDPLAGRYRVARSVAVPLSLKAAPAEPPRASPPAPIPQAAATPGWSRGWLTWGAIAGGLGLATGAVLRYARRRHAATPVHTQVAGDGGHHLKEAEAALAANDALGFHTAVFRLAQTVAARRWNRPAAGITAAILRLDATGDTDSQTLDRLLAELIEECDAVRYGQSTQHPDNMPRTLRRAREAFGSGLASSSRAG
jgi:hypothetical protein